MSALYTTSSFAHDDIAITYYSIVLTIITVLVAVTIAAIQFLSLLQHLLSPTGKFWDGVEVVGEKYDVIGGGIAGLFVVVGVGSGVLYRPWRRWLDERMATAAAAAAAAAAVTRSERADARGLKDGAREEGTGGIQDDELKTGTLIDIERVGESSRAS
jgi:hypothetical protein